MALSRFRRLVTSPLKPNAKTFSVATQEWQPLTLLNGWTISQALGESAAAAWMDPWGNVFLRGAIQGGTVAINTTIFTVPKGMAPEGNMLAFTFTYAGALAVINIAPSTGTGKLNAAVAAASVLTLEGIVWRPGI